VPGVGLEPTRDYSQRILSPLRLPITPSRLNFIRFYLFLFYFQPLGMKIIV